MTKFRKNLGNLGENLVVEAIQQRGWEILARNWRCPLGEIDIVAREDDVIAIIEVKTRRGRSSGTPEQAVDARKQLKLCQLAQCYIENSGWEGDVRLDVVGVELSPQGKLLRITYWREAIECL